MQDLINELKEKAGLTDEQAVKSIETIKEFIQSKLPPMMHGMVDNFLNSEDGGDDQLGDMMKNFGG